MGFGSASAACAGVAAISGRNDVTWADGELAAGRISSTTRSAACIVVSTTESSATEATGAAGVGGAVCESASCAISDRSIVRSNWVIEPIAGGAGGAGEAVVKGGAAASTGGAAGFCS